MTLETCTAVVTGGTKGVGRGVALALAQAGARVFVTGRSADGAANQSVTEIRCDHRQDAQVDAAFARVLGEAGGIDVLVNNVWGGYDNMMENGQFTWPKPFWNSRSGAGTRCSRRACARTTAPASWQRRRCWHAGAVSS